MQARRIPPIIQGAIHRGIVPLLNGVPQAKGEAWYEVPKEDCIARTDNATIDFPRLSLLVDDVFAKRTLLWVLATGIVAEFTLLPIAGRNVVDLLVSELVSAPMCVRKVPQ